MSLKKIRKKTPVMILSWDKKRRTQKREVNQRFRVNIYQKKDFLKESMMEDSHMTPIVPYVDKKAIEPG